MKCDVLLPRVEGGNGEVTEVILQGIKNRVQTTFYIVLKGVIWPFLFCFRFIAAMTVNFSGDDTKLRTAVYPSNRARTPAKLGQNAFQTIPNVSFFGAEKKFF